MIACDMRELRAAGDVADGIDLAVAGAQAGVDGDALRGKANTGRFQPKPFDIGLAASRDQKVGAGDGSLAFPVLDLHRDAGGIAAHGVNLDRLTKLDAFVAQGGAGPVPQLPARRAAGWRAARARSRRTRAAGKPGITRARSDRRR